MIRKLNQGKIDFLVAGSQKAGTSALDKYLRNHPDIGMANRKEVHFFDNEKIFSQSKIDYSLYESHFDFTTEAKVHGESTPIYIYWQPSCKRIFEYNPNMKLIFILRNPIARAYSHWNMEFDRNVEKENFSYAIINEDHRATEALPFQHRVFSYIDRGFYSDQIKRFRQYFNEEQLLFIKYEEFKNNQKHELYNIFDFLGVSSDTYVYKFEEIHNRKKHLTMSFEDKKYLNKIYQDEIRKVEDLLDWNCKDWLL